MLKCSLGHALAASAGDHGAAMLAQVNLVRDV
jgi:hypothetical protein